MQHLDCKGGVDGAIYKLSTLRIVGAIPTAQRHQVGRRIAAAAGVDHPLERTARGDFSLNRSGGSEQRPRKGPILPIS